MVKKRWGSQIVTAARRHETGCIASLSNGETQHFVGSGRDATLAVADYCDRNGLKVVGLSTPASIYRDLQGSYPATAPRGSDHRPPKHALRTPELAMLAAIRRTDLFAP